MAEVKGYQCDKCKKMMQPTEGLHIEGKIFEINCGNKPQQILVKTNGLDELDICPVCFWRSMSAKFKNEIQAEINNSRG